MSCCTEILSPDHITAMRQSIAQLNPHMQRNIVTNAQTLLQLLDAYEEHQLCQSASPK